LMLSLQQSVVPAQQSFERTHDEHRALSRLKHMLLADLRSYRPDHSDFCLAGTSCAMPTAENASVWGTIPPTQLTPDLSNAFPEMG
jgi:hypothetical protein